MRYDAAILVGLLVAAPAPAAPVGPAPYAISGYWMFGRAETGQWAPALDRVRSLGADTVVQFGPVLRHLSSEERTEMDRDPAWGVGEVSLLQATVEQMRTLDEHNVLRRVFVLSSRESYGPALVVRPELDRCFEIADSLIWRLILPSEAPTDRERDVTAGGEYDVVFIRGRRWDSVAELLDEAGRRDMRVYVGMPCPPSNPQYPWDPWLEMMPDMVEVSRRVLQDYSQRLGDKPAFAGVYQSREIPVNARPLAAVLEAYRQMHPVVRAALPGKAILISPYWDARIKDGRDGSAPEDIREGIRQIGRCDVDIIAPQDSRGTAKVGLFWPHQANEPVDRRVLPAVSEGTYAEAYRANTRAFYEAARLGVQDLKRDDGITVQLWANIEAFEPGVGEPCGSFTDCQRTTKERLDQAVMFAGTAPSKLISYIYDSLYTCEAGHELSLADEIAADRRRPIVVDAAYEKREGAAGLCVTGYHIEGCEVIVEWEEAGRAQGFRAPAGAVASARPDLPPLLQTVRIPFGRRPNLLAVSVEGPAGRSRHALYLPADGD